jgi:hypothetical protein
LQLLETVLDLNENVRYDFSYDSNLTRSTTAVDTYFKIVLEVSLLINDSDLLLSVPYDARLWDIGDKGKV